MTIVAIDGHHNMHRILHVSAFQKMSCHGRLTGGAYGGISTIRNVLDQFGASKCVVVWDGNVTYREDRYPEYKAHRRQFKTEEERAEHEERMVLFKSQKLLLTQLLDLLGCHVIEFPMTEGDDLLYAVTKVCPRDRIVIVSEDMDLAQLVSDRVTLYRPGREESVTLDNFVEVTGVPPEKFLMKRALVGDKSDNLVGITGIGEKRATAVLNECGSGDLLTYCYDHKSKPIRRISQHYETVERNLAIMDLEQFPWDLDLLKSISESLQERKTCNVGKVRSMFSSLEFGSLLEWFSSWITPFRMIR